MTRRCNVVKLRGTSDDRHGRTHEVFAPPGFRFDGGEHSKLAYGLREAMEIANETVYPCPAECECRDEEES